FQRTWADRHRGREGGGRRGGPTVEGERMPEGYCSVRQRSGAYGVDATCCRPVGRRPGASGDHGPARPARQQRGRQACPTRFGSAAFPDSTTAVLSPVGG